jgi:D-aminoacyl-tRNA deacylase
MRAVVQRVTRSSVSVDNQVVGRIDEGLLVLLGIARSDTEQSALYMLEKICGLRIFDDVEGKMNLSLGETGGGLLVVSQFTLYGDVRRGKRPSWIDAAGPEIAEPLYEFFVAEARKRLSKVEAGVFRAMMEVELINDGPVTILIDSDKLF